MPTYVYECKSCKNVQEEDHSITISPKISCILCSSECEKKFVPNGNFILKGSDWPSQSFKMKDQMSEKNAKMKTKMVERERSGEGVKKLSDLN